jgi:hypothetical protein
MHGSESAGGGTPPGDSTSRDDHVSDTSALHLNPEESAPFRNRGLAPAHVDLAGASSAQNTIAAVWAEGSTVWILIRRLKTFIRCPDRFPLAFRETCEGEQLVAPSKTMGDRAGISAAAKSNY